MTVPLRILHLEDDANDAELIAIKLASHKKEWPHELLQVSTQKQFSEALDKEPFAVILADNSGPSFNGKDALALTRQKQPEAVFIFVSGYAEEADARKTTADGFVVKDHLQDLLFIIRRALQSKHK